MIGKDEERGSWFVQVKHTDPVTGKPHFKKKRGFKTKREAKIAEAQMMEDRSEPTGVQTFRDVSELYLTSIQASDELKQTHHTRWSKSFSSLYDKPINKITRPMLEAWRAELIKSDYAYNTKKRTMQYVRSVFKYASEIYGLPNPAATLRPIKKPIEVAEEKMHTWTVDEFNTFLAAVDDQKYKLFFETLYWTGMRRGEALALQKADLKENRLFIHASMKHYKNGMKSPKNGSSIRTITLDDQLVEDLQPLLGTPGSFLFGGKTSLSISSVQRHFTKAIELSGVPHIRIHDLRHSHATLLINSGVNIVAVSKRLGHASIEQTLKTYTHLLKKTEDEMMEKIENLHKS